MPLLRPIPAWVIPYFLPNNDTILYTSPIFFMFLSLGYSLPENALNHLDVCLTLSLSSNTLINPIVFFPQTIDVLPDKLAFNFSRKVNGSLILRLYFFPIDRQLTSGFGRIDCIIYQMILSVTLFICFLSLTQLKVQYTAI